MKCFDSSHPFISLSTNANLCLYLLNLTSAATSFIRFLSETWGSSREADDIGPDRWRLFCSVHFPLSPLLLPTLFPPTAGLAGPSFGRQIGKICRVAVSSNQLLRLPRRSPSLPVGHLDRGGERPTARVGAQITRTETATSLMMSILLQSDIQPYVNVFQLICFDPDDK